MSESIEIERPAGDVFAHMTDYARWPDWEPAVVSVTGSGPMALGQRLIERRRMGPRQFEVALTITAFEPSRRWGFEGRGGGMELETLMNLEERGGRTRVQVEGDFRPQGLLRLMSPLLGPKIRRDMASNLRNLKRRLESGAAEAGQAEHVPDAH